MSNWYHWVFSSKFIASLSSHATEKWNNMLNFSYEDITTIVVDNSAAGHVINDSKYFIDNLEPAPHTHVTIIGKETHKPSGKSTARIAFKDDDGTVHNIVLKVAYYFPDSPVNILSVTALADQLDDDDGTWIQTCRHQSIFQWDHGKFQRQFYHPLSGLPGLPLESTNTSTVDKLASFMNHFTHAVLNIRTTEVEGGDSVDNQSYEALDFLSGEDNMVKSSDNGGSAQRQHLLKSCLRSPRKDVASL
jgi:hypothetical protein